MQGLGFEILGRNFHSKFGEIDIIAKKTKILHFIEVKATKTATNSIYRITPAKMDKIIKTINFYFLSTGLASEYQIDAICINGENLEFVENISM